MKNFVKIMEKNGYKLLNTSTSGSMYFSQNIRVSTHYNTCNYTNMREFIGKYPKHKCLYVLGIRKYNWYGVMVFLNYILKKATTYLHWKSYRLCQITCKVGWYPLIQIREFGWL